MEEREAVAVEQAQVAAGRGIDHAASDTECDQPVHTAHGEGHEVKKESSPGAAFL